jgi:RNA polymerase sigma-70 factor, ECF subfamily
MLGPICREAGDLLRRPSANLSPEKPMAPDGGQPTLTTATSTSLLEGLRDPANETVWRAYVERYRPLIVRYAQRIGVPAGEAEDVAQTSLLEFSAALIAGKYDRERGRLRGWMFGIVHRQVSRWRERVKPREVPAADASALGDALNSLAAPDEFERAWEDEWRQAVLRQCLDEVRREVQPTTLRAFERFVFDEVPANQVAAELGITPNAVFGAKRRILERVRALMPRMEELW